MLYALPLSSCLPTPECLYTHYPVHRSVPWIGHTPSGRCGLRRFPVHASKPPLGLPAPLCRVLLAQRNRGSLVAQWYVFSRSLVSAITTKCTVRASKLGIEGARYRERAVNKIFKTAAPAPDNKKQITFLVGISVPVQTLV